ncbi:hypothetical protein B0H16DRAFT_1494764 [Mycena metata]|uniref:F-box domain-containing protein n=1 Tax=Mycena metata TaxID=1033252 RepID=A0AAD7P0N0_9AGAR|nr:hypothetical protein B0H16DRAFT_1494764 [Mycena metata]
MGKHRHGVTRFFTSLWCTTSDDSTLADSDDSTLVEVDAVCHIKRLPDPVLGAIFALNKKADPDSAVERVVAHVAVRWRVCALGLPELWSSIDAHVHPQHQRALLQWYLAHSAERPLDVRIGLSQETWNTGEGRQLLADVLMQESRLRSLSIRADFLGADDALRVALRNIRAPLLDHLSFILLEQHESDPDDIIVGTDFAPTVFKHGVPRLSVLRLQHLKNALYPPLNSVTTLHLEEYHCPPMSSARLKALLHALPALVNLSLYGDMVAHRSWPELYLPRLRSLRSASNAQIGRLLSALDAPALDSLVLKDVHSHELGYVLNRSPGLRLPALRTLTIDGPLETSDLGALFCQLVAIEELRFVNLDADDALALIAHDADNLLSALQRVMVHRTAAYAQGISVSVHADVPWAVSNEELNRVDADDLFMQLRTRRTVALPSGKSLL